MTSMVRHVPTEGWARASVAECVVLRVLNLNLHPRRLRSLTMALRRCSPRVKARVRNDADVLSVDETIDHLQKLQDSTAVPPKTRGDGRDAPYGVQVGSDLHTAHIVAPRFTVLCGGTE